MRRPRLTQGYNTKRMDVTHTESSQKCLYYVVVVGPVWSYDPESYASCSVSNNKASHAGEVEGDDPETKGYTAPPGWGLGHETNYLTSVQNLIVEKPNNEAWLDNSGEIPRKSYKDLLRMIYDR
jgi:hypothetical protein